MAHLAAALGEQALLEGYRLAGALLFPAETDDAVRREWGALPATVRVVILTPRAATALGQVLEDPRSPLTVVLPE